MVGETTQHKAGWRRRGQTPQDFALGIGLFIIAIGFTFAFIPTSLMFTGADPGPTEISQAERAASSLITDLSDGRRVNQLNATKTDAYFDGPTAEADLRDDFGLPSTADINLTVRSLTDGDVITITDSDGNDTQLSAGAVYKTDRPAAEVVRLVRIDLESRDCAPACELIVRVW